MQEIKAPSQQVTKFYSIFLAGAIDLGKAVEWQRDVVDILKDYNVTLFNPRRTDWSGLPTMDNPEFVEQVNWELNALSRADMRVFMFPKDSQAPISFLELGYYLHEPGMICVEDGFYRKGNIKITLERYQSGMRLYDTFGEMMTALLEHLDEIGAKSVK